ncbi:unnamed protein product [Rotaria sordida]|uniref:VCBS repeat-containing protein n=1 Tax=Rotaria sordida TaxID=392033 RepID=A0A820AW82_9BILA|nr:unnamed protein product [Rotaria sordida]
MKLFLTTLTKIPCLPPSTVWRGITKNISEEFQPSTVMTLWPFSSCTVTLPVLENNINLGTTGNRTLLSIEVINGRNIRDHSHFQTEDETLLPPGTRMIIQSQFSPASGLHVIHLKQIIPKEVLLESPFEAVQLFPKIKDSWHRKKRFAISFGTLVTLLIGSIVIGSALGSKFGNKDTNSTERRCSTPYIRVSGTYRTGNTPVSAVLDDFNDASNIDNVVTTQQDNEIALLFGNSEGIFHGRYSIPTHPRPAAVKLRDLNQDKKLDLIVVNQGNNTISVMLDDGNGIFQPHISYPVGNQPCAVVIDDFNNDKKLDLIVTSIKDNTINILLRNAYGRFSAQQSYSAGNIVSNGSSGLENINTSIGTT